MPGELHPISKVLDKTEEDMSYMAMKNDVINPSPVTLIVAVTSVLVSNASPQADLLRHIWLASVPIQAHTFSRLTSSGEYLWTPPSKKSIGGPWRGFSKKMWEIPVANFMSCSTSLWLEYWTFLLSGYCPIQGELIKERFEDVMGHGIFIVDGEQWKHQRKVATVEFSSSKLRDFSVHAYRSEALKLVQILAIAAKNHEIVDLQVYLLLCMVTKCTSLRHQNCSWTIPTLM